MLRLSRKRFCLFALSAISLLIQASYLEPWHAEAKAAGLKHKILTIPAADCSNAEAAVRDADQLRTDWKVSSLREAIKKYEEAKVCWRLNGEVSKEADALKNIADVYYLLGDNPKARDTYAQAVNLNRSASDQNRLVYTLNGLGLISIYVGEVDDALKYSNEALSLSLQIQDKRAQAYALNNIGFAQYRQGKLEVALKTFLQAESYAQETKDPLLLAHVLLNLGYTHNDAGQLEDALNFYRQALSMWQASHNFRGLSRTLTAIGGVLTVLGNIQQALDHHRQALEIVTSVGDLDGEAIVRNSIGYTLEVLGDYEKALDSYLAALKNFNVTANRPGQAQTSQFIGNIYRLLGKTQQAEDYYLKCLSLSQAVKARTLEALALNSLGLMAKVKGDVQESERHFRQALLLYRDIGNRRGEAIALNNLGQLFFASGDKPTAVSFHMQALPLAHATGDSILEITTQGQIAELERDSGRLSEARSHIEAALKTIESIRTRVFSSELRTSYLAITRRQYELYIDVLMQMHKRQPAEGFDAIALRTSELARARNLLDMLIQGQADIREGVSPELLEKERSLGTRLDRLAQRQMRLLGSRPPSEQAKALETEINSLANEYEQVRANIREQSPRYAALTQPKPIGLDEIQQILDNETLLLEYALGDERSYLWAVSKNELLSWELPGRDEIEPVARSVYDLLIANQPRPNEALEQRLARVSKANEQFPLQINSLSRLLLAPVSSKLTTQRLLVVADGALQYIPFQTLVKPFTENAKRVDIVSPASTSFAQNPIPKGTNADVKQSRSLISEHEIITLPSASVLAVQRRELANRTPAPYAIAVLADPVFEETDARIVTSGKARKSGSEIASPNETSSLATALRDAGIDGQLTRLPWSAEEARSIGKLIPRNQNLTALGFKANRQTATSAALSKYRFIHFATHGIMDLNHPELSGIVFSMFDEKGQPQDGYLRLHEIYNLNLPAELVVLSACQTGVGKQIKGEGLIALTRGFMYAGAKRIVASLWKVDDAATAELMADFYKEMFANKLKPAAALRAAQIKMSQKKRWQSPYYWAGFFLQGEWN